MTLAIMQPYLFPYIGYFQLINAVDKFIVYDDVNYIKRGWINRNNILVGRSPSLLTLPLRQASQNKKIHEIAVTADEKEVRKLLKTISHNYKNAPYFEQTNELIEKIFAYSSISIADFNCNQLELICHYLGVTTQIQRTAKEYNNGDLKGEERILDICIREKADNYINPIGGTELYHRNLFEEKGIALRFLKPNLVEYEQFGNPFVPWLSIIDVLMFNGKERTKNMLNQFELI